ncbi:MAG TPA: UDP-N-acetylmuramoyl-L-alanyl-D-glutamate--2,6-diaminopimelate ligase [Burkholderiaceae bacterium]|nr:UDP-N-acetylmuramoyl-L-alanyl-D-glutamate--2,6-diaminopimelate ligase [Burkholderiaceae bacterium]
MKLADLLQGISPVTVTGPQGVDIGEVRDDSRRVELGDLFVAVPAAVRHGTDGIAANIASAVTQGARALVIEQGAAVPASFAGTVVTVPRVRAVLAPLAANRFPLGRELTLTAVTGTNGKTTTTYLLEAMLDAAGIVTGVVGTVAYRVGGGPGATRAPALMQSAPLTTPGALALQRLLSDIRQAGATDAVLEATSHALDQGRLDGCRFRVAGLTHLTQDHLDYHHTMAAYFDAKAILFERLLDETAGVAVLPIDKPEGVAMRARVRGHHAVLSVATHGQPGADVAVETLSATSAGTHVRLKTPLGPIDVESPLVGDFNLQNIVLAVGMAIARGLDASAIATGLRRLPGVPGRLEPVVNDRGVLCLVDYAHTPDGLVRAIEAVRPLVAPGARLITMFGCGGDRDRAKRPLMGEAAARDSDLAIVTSDNPRTEDPASIVATVVEGVRRQSIPELDPAALATASRGACAIVDRRQAIRAAVGAARAGDVVLLAGKGHEDYQILGTERVHFDDREEARAAFATRATEPAS